jgi:Beta-propeller repeat
VSKPFISPRYLPAGSVAGIRLAGIMLLAVVAFAVAILTFGNSIVAKPANSNVATMRPIGSGVTQPTSTTAITPATRTRINATYAALPLAFEANQGQVDPQVKYMARGNGYTLFLTGNDAVISLYSSEKNSEQTVASRTNRRIRSQSGLQKTRTLSTSVMRMHVVNGNSQARVVATDQLPGKINYYIGSDTSKWRTDVGQYARVSYEDVYRGVNLAFHGGQRQMEFDFIVAPRANPSVIKLGFRGARKISTDASGNLVLVSSNGDLMLHRPIAYQQGNDGRQSVDARFVVKANNEVAFALGPYDRSRELVIDPSVTYATYLGGTAEDDGNAIAVDGSGNAYVTGQTQSTNFPTAGGVSPDTNAGGLDAFVTKISPDGSTLVYSTYIGGGGSDSGNAIAVDASGDAFVAGGTDSIDFPTTPGAFQVTPGGMLDAFVLELSSNGGSLVYSTYLGGNGVDVANGIAVDTTGTYVVGSTKSTNFPTQGPIQLHIAGASNGFVTKLTSNGQALAYSTYLGAGTGDSAAAVAVDSSGDAYVTGSTQNPTFPTTPGAFQTTCGTDGTCNGGLDDAFVTVYNPAGSNFVYSTFLGGSNSDQGSGIAVDSSKDAYVTGLTKSSTDFKLKSPLQPVFGGGNQDAFVTELNPAGNALVYSTFLGGTQDDAGTSVAVDSGKNAYVTGQTNSPNFPTVNATQGTLGGLNDAFVTEINATGSQITFSTYLGGSLNENTAAAGVGALGAIAVDSLGANIYVTGNTASTNFPTHAPEQPASGGGTDAFVVKIAQSSTSPDFTISATTPTAVNAGSSATSTVTLTSLNGYNLAVNLNCTVSGGGSPAPACSTKSFSTNPVTPTSTGATSTLTITTTGPIGALLRPSDLFYASWLPIVGLSLAAMPLSSRSPRSKKVCGLLLLGFVMMSLFFLPACGSSSHSTPPPGCTGCTPAGNYTVTITGADAQNLSHSTQVTLTVN